MHLSKHIILMLIAAFIFGPTILFWLTSEAAPWYRPYVAWLAIICIAASLHWRRRS